MFITKTAINRPVTTLMIALGLIFLGFISWRELPVQKLPDITFPSMYYMARTEEADFSPERTNEVITRPFEKMVATLPGLKETYSFTRSGEFWGYARFEQGTDMRFRVIELQDKVNKWTSGQTRRLNTMIVPHSTDEISGRLMEIILSVPVGEEFRTASCGDLIRRKIKSIDGISQVDVAGVMLPNITLETHQDYLVAQGIDVGKMVNILNRLSQDKMWLGALKDGRKIHDVQMVSRISTLEDLLDTRIDEQGVFPLGELVEPRRKAEESKSIYRYNGKKAVRVNISKEKDRNTIQMARKVRRRILEIKEELPSGFDLTVVWDEAEVLERLIRNIAKMAGIGAAMALIVLLFFVKSGRIAMIVVTAIPASILITFNAMYAAGLSINILSLLGLAAGVGMLVDNSIVVVENVFRHFQRNKPPKEAAWLGSREVSRAIMVATATNLVVFVPLLFIDDIMVMVMKEMALSLVFPMVASLLIAITLVPMLTSKVIEATARRRLRREKGKGKISEALEQRGVSRRRVLSPDSLRVRLNPWQRPNRPPRKFIKEFVFYCAKGSLRHPIKLFFIILIILGITLITASIKVAFQRMMERYGKIEELTLYGKPPLGSDLEQADRFFLEKESQVADLVKKSEAFESFSSRFTKDSGEIVLKINKKYQKFFLWDFQNAFRELRSGDQNSGFRFWPFQQLSGPSLRQRYGRGSSGHMERVVVTGDNMDAMGFAAEKVKEFLQKQEVAAEVEIETPTGEPEVHFYPDLELFQVMKADRDSLRSFFQARGKGGIQTQLVLKEEDVERRITVKVLSDEKEEEDEKVRQTLSELKRTLVPLEGGGMVPLDHLGSFAVTHSIPYISKKNRQRELNVGFNLKPMYQKPGMAKVKEEKLKEIQKTLGDERLPSGISAHLSGTLEEAKTSRITWRKLIWLAILSVYLVMAFFFNSLISPLIILITLPLALIGGIWGLVFFRTNLDEIAMLGSIILAGLAVNNGILIVEYTRQMERLHGFRRPRALLSAVSYRLRPILMTSMTTVLGLLPILLSTEAQKEARSLVSVIIGGMLASTFLSLVVVPTFYNVFSQGWEKLQGIVQGKIRLFRNRFRIITEMLPAPAPVASTGAGEIPIPSTESEISEVKEKNAQAPNITCNPQPTTHNHLHISVKNISKIYPVFKFKKLLNVIPSRAYPIGHRPPSGVVALKHVDLEIEPGMFGLLGPNGAGKTTLMKILTGMVKPTYGVAEVLGYDLRFYNQEIRQLISYLPQNFGVYESLTLNQYLNFFAPFYGLHDPGERKRKIDEVVGLVGLPFDRDRPMKNFSGGMKQRAGVAQFFLNTRPVVIVDEPTAGLDPLERVRFRLILSELARTRIVILSTHIVEDITSSCKRLAVLNKGEVIYHGDLDGVQRGAKGLIWDLVKPSEEDVPIPRRRILFRKHIGDRVMYHYVARDPLPGSVSVEATFEDAYVALLLKHNASDPLMPKPNN